MHQLKGLDLSAGLAGLEDKKKKFDDLGITKTNTRKDDLTSFGSQSKLEMGRESVIQALGGSKSGKSRGSDAEFVSDRKKSNSVFKPMD